MVLRSLGVTAAIAAVVSGCGTSEPSPVARSDYVSRVNAVCATSVSRSDKLVEAAFADLFDQGFPETPSPRDLQALYAAILPAAKESERIIEQMLDELRAIPAPDELATDAAALWDAFEERLRTSVRRIEEAVSDPAKAVQLDLDDTFPFSPENARAAKLGFSACNLE